jgi:ketosteroid isomerase-like protein
MAEHPNVARIRRGYDIRGESTDFSEEDRAEIEDLFAEDLVYHGQGTSRFSQDFHGRDQFFEVERRFAQLAGMRQEVLQVFANEAHAVVVAQVHVERDGKETTWKEAELFRFDENGKVTDTWGIPVDQEAVDDFWLGVMSALQPA